MNNSDDDQSSFSVGIILMSLRNELRDCLKKTRGSFLVAIIIMAIRRELSRYSINSFSVGVM